MTPDELYKHFHDIDLNEFQKKNGINPNEMNDHLNTTFYRPKTRGNDEDTTCLICQDEF